MHGLFKRKYAFEDATVWVKYGSEYRPGIKSHSLKVTKDSVQYMNNIGYSLRLEDLEKMSVDDQISILKHWEEIKDAFEMEKRRMLANDEAERKLIFDFKV